MRTEYMTVKELARSRGVSLKAIYDALAVDRLHGARKIGRVWQIPIGQSRMNPASEAARATTKPGRIAL